MHRAALSALRRIQASPRSTGWPSQNSRCRVVFIALYRMASTGGLYFFRREGSPAGVAIQTVRADSRELFYLAPDGSMMSVRVDPQTGLRPSPPVRL